MAWNFHDRGANILIVKTNISDGLNTITHPSKGDIKPMF